MTEYNLHQDGDAWQKPLLWSP